MRVGPVSMWRLDLEIFNIFWKEIRELQLCGLRGKKSELDVVFHIPHAFNILRIMRHPTPYWWKALVWLLCCIKQDTRSCGSFQAKRTNKKKKISLLQPQNNPTTNHLTNNPKPNSQRERGTYPEQEVEAKHQILNALHSSRDTHVEELNLA